MGTATGAAANWILLWVAIAFAALWLQATASSTGRLRDFLRGGCSVQIPRVKN